MIELFLSSIFLKALAVGLVIALLTGMLGVMVVVRRMAFFSDAIAHASLTGIALGLLLQIDPLWSALGFSVLVGLGIAWLSKRKNLSLDTIIGVFYSAAVALGVIIISGLSGFRVDLFSFLFGDILAVNNTDLITSIILLAVVSVLYGLMFNSLVQLALSKDLARVKGIRVDLTEFIFMTLLAITVAVGIKLVGIVLIGPLLIMPAAVAKNLSHSMATMVISSMAVAILGVLIGMFGSVLIDTPVGPTIVIVMSFLFALSLVLKPSPR